jgi:hypothetical protein
VLSKKNRVQYRFYILGKALKPHEADSINNKVANFLLALLHPKLHLEPIPEK